VIKVLGLLLVMNAIISFWILTKQRNSPNLPIAILAMAVVLTVGETLALKALIE